MRYLLCLSIAFFSARDLQAQTASRIDSLLYQLQQETVDTLRIKFLYRLGEAYKVSDLNKASDFAAQGLKEAEAAKWQKGMAAMHLLSGNLQQQQGLIDSALDHYQEALKISKKRGDQHAIASALNDIGSSYYDRSDYLTAMNYYLQALELAEAVGSDHLAGITCENLGSIYSEQENTEKALAYYQRSLDHFKKWGNLQAEASVLAAIGNIYNKEKDITNTEKYYREALELYTELNDPTGMAIIYSHWGVLYENDRAKAIEYQLRSQAIWDSINPLHANAITNIGNMGNNYFEQVRDDSIFRLLPAVRKSYLRKADSLMNLAISYSQSINDRNNEGFFSIKLAALRELTGDFRSAARLLQTGYQIRDSLFSQTHKNQLAEAESSRELALRDQQIRLNELALSAEKRKWLTLLAGAILIGIIGILLFVQNQQRKKSNQMLLSLNAELEKSNRLKAKFFAILSHDLRGPVASLINFLDLQENFPGQLNAEQKQSQQRHLKQAATELLENMETLLIWSKEQMNSFQPELKGVALEQLYRLTEKRLSSSAHGRQLYIATPGAAKVLSDENYLGSILQNIIANALKAVQGRDNGRVEINTIEMEETVLIEISDNGPGLPPEALTVNTEEKPGANSAHGFGLQIIRDLAKAIPCQLEIESRPETGTRFRLRLPRYNNAVGGKSKNK